MKRQALSMDYVRGAHEPASVHDQDSPERRKFPARLADRRPGWPFLWRLAAAASWPTSARATGHAERHFPSAKTVVARRPFSAAAHVFSLPARSAPPMPGAKIRTAGITTGRSASRATTSGDRLTRRDHLYDFIVEIDHNTRPRVAGRGSAVFVHLARDNFGPTAGCVSMTKSAMLHLLRRLGPRTRIVIG